MAHIKALHCVADRQYIFSGTRDHDFYCPAKLRQGPLWITTRGICPHVVWCFVLREQVVAWDCELFTLFPTFTTTVCYLYPGLYALEAASVTENNLTNPSVHRLQGFVLSAATIPRQFNTHMLGSTSSQHAAGSLPRGKHCVHLPARPALPLFCFIHASCRASSPMIQSLPRRVIAAWLLQHWTSSCQMRIKLL